MQLKVRDLEGALEVEKSAVDEAKHNLDTLTKQHRFVMRRYRSATLLLYIHTYIHTTLFVLAGYKKKKKAAYADVDLLKTYLKCLQHLIGLILHVH